MKYIFVVIIVVFVVVLLMVIFRKKAKCSNLNSGDFSNQLVSGENYYDDLIVRVEMLPVEAIPDESKLVEIKNSKVLAQINNLVPELAKVGNTANNTVQAIRENGKVLYEAVIPVGAKLADSKSMNGAVRGIYHGNNGIKGQANFVAVNGQKGSVVANSAASAMGVASMVVGQYYMDQINSELEKISDSISKISDFQDNEYRSKVLSLMSFVKRISDFQTEVIENNELRLSKISQLDRLEENCTQLLGHANFALVKFTENDFDYKSYEKKLPEIQNWYLYQNALMEILFRISDLKYTLNLGNVSREQCSAVLLEYKRQFDGSQAKLIKWHKQTMERLKIDLTEIRRKRSGLDGAIHYIPGLINEKHNYRGMNESTAEMLRNQSEFDDSRYVGDTTDLYSEDVHLIAKDNKIYYLL